MTVRDAQRLAAGLGLLTVLLLAGLTLDSIAYGHAVRAAEAQHGSAR